MKADLTNLSTGSRFRFSCNGHMLFHLGALQLANKVEIEDKSNTSISMVAASEMKPMTKGRAVQISTGAGLLLFVIFKYTIHHVFAVTISDSVGIPVIDKKAALPKQPLSQDKGTIIGTSMPNSSLQCLKN